MTESKVVAGYGMLAMGILGTLVGSYIAFRGPVTGSAPVEHLVWLAAIPIGLVIGMAAGGIIDEIFLGAAQ